MKVLKALLAVLTALAVALTAALLFIQDKNAPRYIQIYENEQYPRVLHKSIPQPERCPVRAGGCLDLRRTPPLKNASGDAAAGGIPVFTQ